jgi:iron complex transport system substrate-binding protein
MRIVSLLPSATEVVYALGLGDELVGVTFECDWPPEARTKRVVSLSSLPPETAPAEIDRLVNESIGGGDPIYRLDNDAIRELQPDLVLTQDLCAVCAVPTGTVEDALDVLGCRADVVSLDPSSLDDIIESIVEVGARTGAEERSRQVADSLRARLEWVRAAVGGLDRPRTLALEWSDPPFNGGHWVPDMIDVAGGDPVLASWRTPSIRLDWDDIASASPDAVVFMPCGYDLDHAVEEGASLLDRPELGAAPAIYAVDASAYFSRPGPRVVAGVEILASCLHPGSVPPAPVGTVARLR